MESRRAIGRNMVWNTAGLTVETTAGFLIMPFLIARLGNATYGIWIVLGAMTSYFGLLDLGIRGSIGRYVAFYRSTGNQRGVNQTVTGGVVILFLVGSAAALMILACETLFFRVFDISSERQDDAGLALRIIAVQFALSLFSTVFDATLWGFQRFDWLNAVDIPAAIVRAGLTFALIGSEGDLIVLACITLGVTSVSGLAKVALSFRASPQLRIGPSYLRRPAIRELLGFGSWNLIGNVARVTRRQFSPLLIGSFLGLSLVASFSIADRLLTAVAAALAAVTGVLTPFATTLHATDQVDRQRRLFLTGSKYFGALAAFLTAFMLVLGRPLITLWIGPTFADSAVLLAILATGELLPGMQFVTNGILVATARHRCLAAFGLLEALAVCLLTVILIPAFGLVGAGLAIAAPAFLFRGVVPMVYGCWAVGIPLRQYLAQSIGPSLLCAAMPAVLVGLVAYDYPPLTWPQFAAYGVGYTILFAVCSVGLLGRGQLWTPWTRTSPAGAGRTGEVIAGPTR